MKPGPSWLFGAFCFFLPLTCAQSSLSWESVMSEVISEYEYADPPPQQKKMCAGNCGLYKLNDATDACQCDNQCYFHHDCCPDMETECPHIGNDTSIPKTECRGFQITEYSKFGCSFIKTQKTLLKD